MKKMICCMMATCIALCTLAQGRLLDQKMDIKKVNVTVTADCFTATTFVVMEFYNPHDQEIEGLYRFRLAPGQVITAFQLDLNGQYRDGSIEEKSKATNAYNTIVGKRIDPALLSWEGTDSYRLNVYPVPAKSTRKIKMTIQQPMKVENEGALYQFSLNTNDIAEEFHVDVNANCGNQIPTVKEGWLSSLAFKNNGSFYKVQKNGKKISLKEQIRFLIPFSGQAVFCTKSVDGKTVFALRKFANIPKQINLKANTIRVFWDVSGSSESRNIDKEINFLEQYLKTQNVNEMVIVPFAEQTFPEKVFYPSQGREWKRYIQTLEYDGATRFDGLDLSNNDPDVVFVFTDGQVSYGGNVPKPSRKPLFAVNSSQSCNNVFLHSLVGSSGGAVIDLNSLKIDNATKKARVVNIRLIDIKSMRGNVKVEILPGNTVDAALLYGTIAGDDTLVFVYGNSSSVYREDKAFLSARSSCNTSAIDRLPMLYRFVNLPGQSSYDVLKFGIEEKVVTQYTSYIVLERVEDYIRYNITPPKELEAACLEKGFVKQKYHWELQQKLNEVDILRGVVDVYNWRLKQWDPQAGNLVMPHITGKSKVAVISGEVSIDPPINNATDNVIVNMNSVGMQMEEVVVTGYSRTSRASYVGAASKIMGKDIANVPVASFDQILQGRAPGLMVWSDSGEPGAAASVEIRGPTSILGGNSPLYVIDGIPVEAGVFQGFNSNDIQSIDILKDASATALYGSRGAAGVIVITTKRGRLFENRYRDRTYELSKMDDVYYMQEISGVSVSMKPMYYQALRKEYGTSANFYIDMAEHFHASGLVSTAHKILLNAAEVTNGHPQALRAVAYVLESWGEYDKAIEIYRQVLKATPGDLGLHRDLGWALYRSGSIQEALDHFYLAITLNLEAHEYYSRQAKATILEDMNAIIAAHEGVLNLKKIDSALIHPITADLRISLSGNVGISAMTIIEPDKSRAHSNVYRTKNGGHVALASAFWQQGRHMFDYKIKNAIKGSYRVELMYYDYNPYPAMARIITFRNFGKSGQSISVENVLLNNQNGEIEIGKVEWR